MSSNVTVKLCRGCTGEGEPVCQMMRSQFIYQVQRLIAAAGFSFGARFEKLIRRAAHRRNHNYWLAVLMSFDNPGNARNSLLRLDGGTAELHHNHLRDLIKESFRYHQFRI